LPNSKNVIYRHHQISTTTKIATFSTSSITPKTQRPLVVEKEVKLTSSQPKNNNDLSVEKDNERSTRSYQTTQGASQTQSSTAKPRKQKEKKEKSEMKVENVKGRA
jgi:hypothetical protein